MDSLRFIKVIKVRIVVIDMVIVVELARTVNLVEDITAKEVIGIAVIKRKGYIIVVVSHILIRVHISFHCTVTKLVAIEVLRI